ncbi:MAG: hypothetical protein EKK64_03055 [Neisseriaceae bacterium]|nr:MAG: hypothetical protein EKK64_03055 [Neisseriaceae bacterium]
MYCLTIKGKGKFYKALSKLKYKTWKKVTDYGCYINHRKTIGKPSIEYENGDKDYWFDGFKYVVLKTDSSTEIFISKNMFESTDLHSFDDHPSVVYFDGTKEWHQNGLLHRHFRPAVEYKNGDQEWWRFGKRHRTNGPAVVIGEKQYWFENGEFIKCIV